MFFDENGWFRLDEMVVDNPTFKKIMADDRVTDEEVTEQSQRVIALYRELEQRFTPEQLALIAEAITQTGVLYAVTRYQELQEFHR